MTFTTSKAKGPERQPQAFQKTTSKHADFNLRLSPRQARVLDALIHAAGWVWREQVDRIARASNGPDVIARLRHKLGEGAIETDRVDTVDYDGRPSNPGRYRLTGAGHRRIAELRGLASVKA